MAAQARDCSGHFLLLASMLGSAKTNKATVHLFGELVQLRWKDGWCSASLVHGPVKEGSLISYLVDPASSHMLVSKIKPCMSKYKHLYCETANGSLNQLSFI